MVAIFLNVIYCNFYIIITQINLQIQKYITQETSEILYQKMSTLRPDQFPSYQQAGYRKKIKEQQSTQICLKPQNQQIHINKQLEKYSKSFRQQPGVTIRHYGVTNDPLPPVNYTYGVPTEKSQGAQNVMKSGQVQGVNQFLNELNQSKYKSFKKQPLGQTVNRNYNLPEQAKQQDFRFGLGTEKNEFGAKQTIYSAINMPQNQQIRQMYLKSHGDYDAGEQKNREYDWKIDPSDFRFGKVQKNIIPKQMHQIMSPEGQNNKFPDTKFVKSNLNDFSNRRDDKLGKPANLGQKQFPSDHAFGVRVEPNEWDAGKCLRGQANTYEVRPDDDLGKSNRFGFRNIPKQGDELRVFGVPTIRYDIKKPERQSVADPNNYADETTAIELLFPKQFSSFGVGDQDFDKPRPKKQIRQIFENIGFRLKENIFNAIFERSKAIEGTILQKVSCNSFKKALYEMSTPVL